MSVEQGNSYIQNNTYNETDDSSTIRHTNVMNVFMAYFKQQFGKPESTTLFDELDQSRDDSTNRQMELLFEHIIRYNQESNEEKKEIHYPGFYNLDDASDLYQLDYKSGSLDNEIRVQCPLLVPLLYFIVDEKPEYWSITNLAS